MSKQITTIARLKAKPGAEARLEEALKKLIEPTRAESGCIDYTLHRDLEQAASAQGGAVRREGLGRRTDPFRYYREAPPDDAAQVS